MEVLEVFEAILEHPAPIEGNTKGCLRRENYGTIMFHVQDDRPRAFLYSAQIAGGVRELTPEQVEQAARRYVELTMPVDEAER